MDGCTASVEVGPNIRRRVVRRYAGAAIILSLLGLGLGWLGRDRISALHLWTPPPVALGHLAASASQQGLPTTAGQAKASIAHDLVEVQKRAATEPTVWSDQADLAELYLARTRLTGSFDDYAAAGRAFDAAFKVSPPHGGPNLQRASWNFAVHRLNAIEPDLKAVEHYVIPDDAEVASVIGLRGDVLFYNGRYREALQDYERSAARMPSLGADIRIANYWARMGDEARANRFLDQAARKITGPQQQLKAYVELRRGMLDLDRGRWDQAQAHFERADDIFPGYWIVQQQLGSVRALKGVPDQAMAVFRRMAAADGNPEGYDDIAGLYRAQGDFADAQAWAAKAGVAWDQRLALLPDAALGHTLDHLLAFGDPARALEVAKRNYALRPYGDSATGLAWAYMANHRPADALNAIAPTLKSGWYSAEPHIVASEAYALLGQGEQADVERKAALAINPHSFDRNPGMTWLEQ